MNVLLVAGVAVIGGAACDRSTGPTVNSPQPEFPIRRFNYSDTDYPLHFYGDETDTWEYMTPTTPAWAEIPADDQTPHSEDGWGKRRVCPNDQMIMKNAHLRMNYGLETLDFDFRGPFTFIRHVSTLPPAEGGSPFPTAAYRFHQNAYTRDDKYYAPAGGQVLLACDGYYVVNNALLRVWVGHLYGKAYTGDIVRNPRYSDGGCDDGGFTTLREEEMNSQTYDPYDQDPGSGQGCDGGTRGSGGDSDGGSGTQFQPGDHTGGETVDWNTGIGNGGKSVCGDNAKVELICIDVWVEGEGWVEWSCGYATTC